MSTPSGTSSVRERDRLLQRPAAVDPVAGRDADGQRQLGRPGRAHRRDDLEQEARAAGEVAAVAIAALVGERREELVQQVAVRRVHLEQAEAGRVRAPRGRREGLDDPLDLARSSARAAPASRRRRRGRSARRLSSRRSSGPSARLPRQGASTDALRPACAIWMPGTAPCSARNAVIGWKAATCSSDQMPESSGLMRPSGVTALASTITAPAPPVARAPRCTRCQSLGHAVAATSTGTWARPRRDCGTRRPGR